MNYRDGSANSSAKPDRLEVGEVENYLEEILEVRPKPLSCSKTLNCGHKGARNHFEVEFKLFREHRGIHIVKFGLRSGKLQLYLEPLRADRLQPENEIKPAVIVEEVSTSSRKVKLSAKDPTLSENRSKTVIVTRTQVRISCGGTHKKPYWFFEAFRDQVLEGTAKNLICTVRPQNKACCRYRYEFVIEKGDWSYDMTIHPKTSWMGQKFSQLKLKAYCKKKVRDIYSHVNTKLGNTVAKGSWTCSAKK